MIRMSQSSGLCFCVTRGPALTWATWAFFCLSVDSTWGFPAFSWSERAVMGWGLRRIRPACFGASVWHLRKPKDQGFEFPHGESPHEQNVGPILINPSLLFFFVFKGVSPGSVGGIITKAQTERWPAVDRPEGRMGPAEGTSLMDHLERLQACC